jgi:hypothetical protein
MSFSEDPTQGAEHGGAAGEDPAGSEAADTTGDPTQGTQVGERLYEDPTQGSEVGEAEYEDPTQGAEVGFRPGEDPMAPSR